MIVCMTQMILKYILSKYVICFVKKISVGFVEVKGKTIENSSIGEGQTHSTHVEKYYYTWTTNGAPYYPKF